MGTLTRHPEQVILGLRVSPALCLSGISSPRRQRLEAFRPGASQSFCVLGPSLGLSFLFDRVECSVALCVLRDAVQCVRREEGRGTLRDRWDAPARCQAGGLNPPPSQAFPGLQGYPTPKGPMTSSILVTLINGHRVHGRQQPAPLSRISYDLRDWVPQGVTI